MDRHLWLIGMMGSGKTATARALGGRWQVHAIDTDTEVVSKTGCSIAQLWSERGEQAFRDIEAAAVRRIAERRPAVIATGGGVVLDERSVTTMRSSGRIVWLAASPAVLGVRVGDGRNRPLLVSDASPERLEEILRGREQVYESAADLVVDTDELSVSATADRIEAWWNRS